MPSAERKAALVDACRTISARLPGRWDRRLRESGKYLVNYKGARGAGLNAWRFARLGRRHELVVAPFGDGAIVVETADDEIGRIVYMRGGYEREYMETGVAYLTANGLLEPGRAFVDVGANIGTSTIDAVARFGFGRAVSFEPDRRNFRLLRANVALNDIADRVDARLMALSDHEGSIIIERRDGNSGDSRTLDAADSTAGNGDAVRCARLDTLVEAGELDVSDAGLLWVDAQGHDAHVLAGASTLTSAGVPVFVEYWPRELDSAGGLERFEAIAAEHYSHAVDVRALERGLTNGTLVPTDELATLRDRYAGARLTDLLLIRSPER